jgi:hypothetical protein
VAIDTEKLEEMVTQLMEQREMTSAMLIRDALDYIATLRRQLNEAHSHNCDSQRLDWLEAQSHFARSDASHRNYYTLPRILCKKKGESMRTLRKSIDDLRHVEDGDV